MASTTCREIVVFGADCAVGSIEGVAVGVKITRDNAWETGVLNDTEARIAGEASSCSVVVGVTVGVNRLADGILIKIEASHTLYAGIFGVEGSAAKVADGNNLHVGDC